MARIPRVPGGEIHRYGQGGLGHVLWAPHACTNQNLAPQSEHNTEANIHLLCPAASALPALVMSKGHHVEEVSERPLVIEDKFEGFKKNQGGSYASYET